MKLVGLKINNELTLDLNKNTIQCLTHKSALEQETELAVIYTSLHSS